MASSQLVPGISRLSRSQAYAKRALFKKAKAVATAPKAAPATTKLIKKVPALKSYLNASFSLSKGEFPHQMKF